jgi:Outer membrane lipoprotein carrier protein LolA-like
MRWGHAVRTSMLAPALAWAACADAQPITVAGLQSLLQEAPKREVRFHETRESQWLAAPVETSGSMKSGATMLEKRIEQPRRETWRILDDRMQLVAPGSSAVKQFMFSQAPAVAALANALRQVMAGDLQALGQDFQLAPGGDERLWTLQLTPRRQDIARFLKQLELQGTGADVQVIVILESQGDRTTTRLIYEP